MSAHPKTDQLSTLTLALLEMATKATNPTALAVALQYGRALLEIQRMEQRLAAAESAITTARAQRTGFSGDSDAMHETLTRYTETCR